MYKFFVTKLYTEFLMVIIHMMYRFNMNQPNYRQSFANLVDLR